MKLPELKIRHLVSKYPVIQAGMGVRVGNSRLASETIKLGGYGTIASVGLGDIEKSKTDFVFESNRVLIEEIRQTRELTGGKGPLGINVMVALSNYAEINRAAAGEGIDFIISGAGLPIQLPEYVGDRNIALIPVISSGRALHILLAAWKRKYNRAPDAVIVEGPKCGGHLGFTLEQIKHPETCSMDILFKEIKNVLCTFKYNVPVIAAEEVASREDIEKSLQMGYDGVQIGTYFIATEESGMDIKSKEVFVKAGKDDVVVIKSPVGLPVRVLRTPLAERILKGEREKFACPYRCLRSCNPAKAPFCIAKALLATWSGDVEHGLYMTGCNITAIKGVIKLKDFFDTITIP
ncbi:MAG: nitronate monooxygenase family protein [Verrucomicrobiota bacterium]